MDLSNINTIEELIQAIDDNFKTPKRPGVTGAEANVIFKKMVQLLEKQTNTYNDIADRDTDASVRDGIYGFVIDASADPDVDPGQSALYIYKLDEWKRVAIVDDLNVTLEWDNITGKPNSTPAEIDNAVAKVKFTESFEVNFPNNTSGLPNGTVINAGDEIEGKLRQFFRKASPPVYVTPVVSLVATPAQRSYEVGTLINILLDGTFTQNDGGNSTATSVQQKNGSGSFVEIATSEPHSETDVEIGTDTKTYRIVYNYAQGPVKNDSLGQPDAAGRIPAGAKNTNEIVFSGFRNAFIGFTLAEDSAAIRLLPIVFNNPQNGSEITVSVPAGAVRVSIFYPASLQDLSQVLYIEDSNKNITGNFSKRGSAINVNGANSFTAIAYKAFDFIPVEAFPSAVTYKFKI